MSLPTPAEIGDLHGAPSAEVAPLVERAAREADERILFVVTALLVDRALDLVREGSRRELLEEALAVSGGISGDAGEALRERDPKTFGAWSALDNVLAEAGRRSDPAAVKSILLSTRGRGQEILELLAREKHRPVPRAEIRQRLDLPEAQLSHLLRDLEEADLILRYREGGSREVLVELGRVGREYVSQSILPDWIARLVQAAEDKAGGVALNAADLTRDLVKAGAPSEAAAEQLAAIVAGTQVTKKVEDVEQAGKVRFLKSTEALSDGRYVAGGPSGLDLMREEAA